jgi:hypothetical protein
MTTTPSALNNLINKTYLRTPSEVVEEAALFLVTKNLTKTELEIALKANDAEFDPTGLKVVELKAKAIELGIPTDKQVVGEPKAEPLNNKHLKNMVFGYWMALKMKTDGLVDEATFNSIVTDYLKAFADVSDQTTYYDQFILDTKTVTKELKKSIKDFHKPVKVKKEKVVKEKAAKKGRKAAEKTLNNDDIVASIVAASLQASTEPPIAETVAEPIAETPAETVAEPVAEPVAETVAEPIAETVAEPIAETPAVVTPIAEPVKPKRKYTRKKKVEAPAVEEPLPIPILVRNDVLTEELSEEEMEEELDVEAFTAPDGKKYLIDQQKNLYDFVTHEPIL